MTDPLTARLRFLTSLSESDLNQLENARATNVVYAAHSDLLAEGEAPDHLHILLKGWAARYRILDDGRRQFTALLVPGDLCDIDGLLLSRIHCGVTALTPCTVALISHLRLRTILDGSPPLKDAFWWLTFVENAISAEWSVGLGRRSAVERLAHLLCELLVRLETVKMTTGDAFDLPLTQEQLADALGLSLVHVSRTIQELKKLDLINLENRRLSIRNLEALKTLANFSSSYLHSKRERLGPVLSLR